MEGLVRNEVISVFMETFRPEEYTTVFTKLILIGIEQVLHKFHEMQSKADLRSILFQGSPNINPTECSKTHPLISQINQIKGELERINKCFESVVSHAHHHEQHTVQTVPQHQNHNLSNYYSAQTNQTHTLANYNPQDCTPSFKQPQARFSTNSSRPKHKGITPKVTEVFHDVNLIENPKKIVKHHLDDHQLKEALTYDSTQESPPNNKKFIPKKAETVEQNQTQIKQLATTPMLQHQRSNAQIPKPNQRTKSQTTEQQVTLFKKKRSPDQHDFTTVGSRAHTNVLSTNPSIGPKYLQKVESKIKDMVRRDRMKSQDRDRSLSPKEVSAAAQATRKPQRRQDDKDEFSPFKNESKIVIGNKFINSQIGLQFSDSVQSYSANGSEELSSRSSFSAFNAALIQNNHAALRQYTSNSDLESMSSATNSLSSSSQSRKKEVGKISRMRS